MCDYSTSSAPEAQIRSDVMLSASQLTRLAQAVAVAVADALSGSGGAGRSSYSIAEVAKRAGVSDDYVRADIARGLLRVVRPGARDIARVLPKDELLWLTGRLQPNDLPAEGMSSKIAQRNRTRAIVASVLRKPAGNGKVHRIKA